MHGKRALVGLAWRKRYLVALAWRFLPRKLKLIAGGVAVSALLVLAGALAALALLIGQLA